MFIVLVLDISIVARAAHSSQVTGCKYFPLSRAAAATRRVLLLNCS